MSGRRSALLITMIAASMPWSLAAQRLTLDARGAVAVPQELAGTSLSTGGGFGAVLAYRVLPHLGVYGGWDWMHFGADNNFGGVDVDFNETGYTFGLRFEHPFASASAIRYRLEGGGTYKHVEVENPVGDLVFDTKHGLGFEAAAGVVVPVGGNLRLVPAVRYRALTRDYEVGSATVNGDLRYVALEVGVAWRF